MFKQRVFGLVKIMFDENSVRMLASLIVSSHFTVVKLALLCCEDLVTARLSLLLPRIKSRGNQVYEYILSCGLNILNVGTKPTFVTSEAEVY